MLSMLVTILITHVRFSQHQITGTMCLCFKLSVPLLYVPCLSMVTMQVLIPNESTTALHRCALQENHRRHKNSMKPFTRVHGGSFGGTATSLVFPLFQRTQYAMKG
jgi:hypothetical protein